MRNNRKDGTMGLTEYGHIATEETQLRVADLLQAIAAGSAGPEYTDATFKALLDDTNTTEIFSAWWPLSAASNDSKYKRLLRFFTMLQTDKTYTVKFPSPAVSTNPAGTPADDLAGKSAAALATDSTNPEDWAAEDRMTWYIRANAVSLADGTIDVLAIEGEEELTSPARWPLSTPSPLPCCAALSTTAATCRKAGAAPWPTVSHPTPRTWHRMASAAQ